MYDLLISNQEQCFGTHQFITMPYIDLLLFKRVVPIIFSIWSWKCFFQRYLAPAYFWHCLFLLSLTKFTTITPVSWLGMLLWSSLWKCNNALVASCTMSGVCFGGEARFVHASSPCVCIIVLWHMMLHTGWLACDAVMGLGYCKSLRCAFYLLHVKMVMGWGGWFGEGRCGVSVAVNHSALANLLSRGILGEVIV